MVEGTAIFKDTEVREQGNFGKLEEFYHRMPWKNGRKGNEVETLEEPCCSQRGMSMPISCAGRATLVGLGWKSI